MPKGTPDQRLVVPVPVGVGGVDEVHTQVKGVMERGDGLSLIGRAVGAGHPPAAQTDSGDFNATCAK
jgi:hypothetical protein